MSLRRAQNIFMPKNINSITINITLESIEEIKTEKNDIRTLRRIFFSPAQDYLILIFYWLISAG